MAEAQLPKQVDAVKLVNVNQRLTAKIDSKYLTRLAAAVVRCDAPVECDIEFAQDMEKHRLMKGSCKTQVVMICQRCLGEIELPVQSDFEIGLVFNDEQAAQLPRRLEPVELDAEGHLNLWEVMEDEVLLALPMLPMHSQGECQAAAIEPDAEITNSDDERPNPFAVLAKLKQK